MSRFYITSEENILVSFSITSNLLLAQNYQERPYHSDSTASRLLSEVKHCRARLVLRWGTTLESRVLFFCTSLLFANLYLSLNITSKAQPMLLIHDVSIFQLWFWAWPICIWRGYHGTGLMSTPKCSNFVLPSSRFVIKYWSLCWCKCLYLYTKHSTSLGSFDPIFSTGLKIQSPLHQNQKLG